MESFKYFDTKLNSEVELFVTADGLILSARYFCHIEKCFLKENYGKMAPSFYRRAEAHLDCFLKQKPKVDLELEDNFL